MQELTQSTYYQVKLWVIFVSLPALRVELKDLISYLDKSCIVYKFKGVRGSDIFFTNITLDLIW